MHEKFNELSEKVKSLPDQPNEVLLKLYALYKQGMSGDVQKKRPGLLDLRGRAKYDAWKKQAGLSQEEAQLAYINYAEKLLEENGLS